MEKVGSASAKRNDTGDVASGVRSWAYPGGSSSRWNSHAISRTHEQGKTPRAAASKLVPRKKVERRRRGLFRPARQPWAITEFQSDAIEIEQRTPPRLARLTLYCVLALLFV